MKRSSYLSSWLETNTTPILLALPMLLLAVATQLFGTVLFVRIITVLFINLVVVTGLQVFMGNSGILNFAHLGFMGIGAYASVLFSMTQQAKAATLVDLYTFLRPVHTPFLVAVLIGALVAAFVAAIISYPLMRLSDAAAVITIFAVLVIINVVLVHWSAVTNGPRTLFGVDFHTTLWVSVTFGLIVIFLGYWFKESSWGLKLRASRDDRYAAASIGIDLVRVRWIAFIFGAFIAGFGGGLYAHFITSFSPYAFYLTETFIILSMLVVGGPGSVSGAVIGTVVVTFLREGLRFIENSVNISGILPNGLVGFTEVFLATLLIIILALRPAGIMAGREVRWPRRRKKSAEEFTPKTPRPEEAGIAK